LFLLQNIIPANSTSNSSHLAQPTEEDIRKSPIEHIIVIIQGGHSFDNYFGTFPYADGIPTDIKIPSNPFSLENSTYIKPFHIEFTRYFKPNDDNYRLSYNNGSMNGFVYASRNVPNNAQNVMGFYNNKDIPYYWQFASEYVLAQRFFSPSMRSDLVNNLYAIGVDPLPYLNLKKIPEKGLEANKTLFDELENNRISWKVYIENYSGIKNLDSKDRIKLFNNIPVLGINRFNDNQSLRSHFEDLHIYYRDIRNNNFPAVNYVFFTNTNDSPNTKVKEAQRAVATLVYALMKSNYWNNSAIILTQNEPGGWYDHVIPPINNNTKELHGFRVPAIFISPFARESYIDNHTYDMSSVIRFIESTLEINSSLMVTKNASNILQAFDFTLNPRKPVYLEEITRETSLIKSNNTGGINNIYAISLLILVMIIIFWYYKTRSRR
jgi:phospholipase C